MSKDHAGDFRGYVRASEAWYYPAARNPEYSDEVSFGFYNPLGGTSGELIMQWYHIGGHDVPRLGAFDASWHALWECRDLLEKLADQDDTNVTPSEFCALLDSLGFVDKTPRTREELPIAEQPIKLGEWRREALPNKYGKAPYILGGERVFLPATVGDRILSALQLESEVRREVV